jgi:hypothetical protein
MKKVLFPLVTALMVGCLSLQSVMAVTATLTSNDANSRINVHTAPSIESPFPQYGLPGDIVEILRQTKGKDGYTWYYVKFKVSGAKGWVRQDLIKLSSSPNSSSPQNNKGVFIIPSTSVEGTAFTNAESCPIEVNFHADGQWSYNPSKGLHTASGYPNAPRALPAYILPGVPEGSLVVRRGNGNYEYIGQDKTLHLQPREIIHFMINDDYQNNYGAGYADNEGKLSVEWNYSPCNSIAYTGDQGGPLRPIDSEGRRLHSAGIWIDQREQLKVQAGQGIHLVLRNVNVFPVDVDVRDTSFTAGTLQRTVVIPPLGKADIVLSKFGLEPMTWDLLISSDFGRENVFIVNWELYSTWIPGDPQNR